MRHGLFVHPRFRDHAAADAEADLEDMIDALVVDLLLTRPDVRQALRQLHDPNASPFVDEIVVFCSDVPFDGAWIEEPDSFLDRLGQQPEDWRGVLVTVIPA